jgi:GTP cyclohydrolase I
VDLNKIELGVELILKGLGCDLADRNFLDTPNRVARFYEEMFSVKETEWATFPENYTDFILLKHHIIHSLCPHHLLVVEFDVSLAYIPNGQVLGLSKLARVFDEANSRPLLQEKLTGDVVDNLTIICPGVQGIASLIVGQHDCTKVRGIKSPAKFVTYRLEGRFKEDKTLEDRFFRLCGI